MSETLGGRIKHAWNAFVGRDKDPLPPIQGYGPSYGIRPDRPRLNVYNDRSIVAPIINQIAVDASLIEIRHIRTDEDGRYQTDINSGLNNCLTLEANLDQGATAFRQDMVTTLLDKGVMAVVPVDTNVAPDDTGGYDIRTLRVGEIVEWFPRDVGINLYNAETGRQEYIVLPKSFVAIVENPLYTVMNEPNSTLKRLTRKLSLLDMTDERIASGKLDLIMQLPYVIKHETRREQAEKRRKDLEDQLKGSTYGIGYIDGTERITQLNRPAENNLLKQVESLTEQLYRQLGLTPEVFDGTASEEVMINYHNRTLTPILNAIVEAMKRSFLTKTARTQGQSIFYFRDPFKLVPVSQIAEIADKLTRNEVATSNEMRQAIGLKPVKSPEADELRNKNLPKIKEEEVSEEPTESKQKGEPEDDDDEEEA